ncbi:hypothetical protein POUND7_005791 [Theobroma cacao]
MLKNEVGDIKIQLVKVIGLVDSNLVELHVINEAYKIFATLEWTNSHGLVMENDSSNAVKWIRRLHGDLGDISCL